MTTNKQVLLLNTKPINTHKRLLLPQVYGQPVVVATLNKDESALINWYSASTKSTSIMKFLYWVHNQYILSNNPTSSNSPTHIHQILQTSAAGIASLLGFWPWWLGDSKQYNHVRCLRQYTIHTGQRQYRIYTGAVVPNSTRRNALYICLQYLYSID